MKAQVSILDLILIITVSYSLSHVVRNSHSDSYQHLCISIVSNIYHIVFVAVLTFIVWTVASLTAEKYIPALLERETPV